MVAPSLPAAEGSGAAAFPARPARCEPRGGRGRGQGRRRGRPGAYLLRIGSARGPPAAEPPRVVAPPAPRPAWLPQLPPPAPARERMKSSRAGPGRRIPRRRGGTGASPAAGTRARPARPTTLPRTPGVRCISRGRFHGGSVAGPRTAREEPARQSPQRAVPAVRPRLPGGMDRSSPRGVPHPRRLPPLHCSFRWI